MKRWRDRFREAKKRGQFTHQDETAAGNWWSCSLGEAVKDRGSSVTKVYTIVHDHTELDQLGMEFWRMVKANDVDGAIKCHRGIRKALKGLGYRVRKKARKVEEPCGV